MANQVNNVFTLSNLTASDQSVIQAALNRDSDPFEALFRGRGLEPHQFRWDGDTTCCDLNQDGKFHGSIFTAWAVPFDLVEDLGELNLLDEWLYWEESGAALGKVTRDGGHYESPDPEDPDEYENIFEHMHPHFEDGQRCKADPGEMVCDEHKIYGVCVEPGVILPFGGSPVKVGRVSTKHGWLIRECELEEEFENPRDRKDGCTYTQNVFDLVEHLAMDPRLT